MLKTHFFVLLIRKSKLWSCIDSCQSYLALPVWGVDEDDAVGEMAVWHQDVVQLVVNSFAWNLTRRGDKIGTMKNLKQSKNLLLLFSNWSRLYLLYAASFYLTCRWQRVSSERSLSRLLALSLGGRLGCLSLSDVLRPRRPANFGSTLQMKTKFFK